MVYHHKTNHPLAPADTKVPHPPKAPTMPPPPPPPKRGGRGGCFCNIICWMLSLLLLLIIILGVILGALYLIFKPKLPNYSVESIRVSDLRLNLDMTLYAKFDVKITAKNPNKNIGIYYEKGGRLSVWFTKSQLCEGSLPIFYQGHQNSTILDVSLSGEVESGTTLMSALQQQQQTGRVPLDLKVDAPVAIKLGEMHVSR